MKKNKTIYELNPSQDVVALQCKYTLFKRVINILTSVSLEEEVDFNIMKDAFNLLVERNDCLRIKFFKKKGKTYQYFDDPKLVKDIPVLKFETEKEQKAFIDKTKKRAIAYLKGKVIEPYFIKTYDNKYMVLFKVCHLILDIYGINMIFKDLLEIYDALKNKKELPLAPGRFEDVVKKDLEKKYNEKAAERDLKFFKDLLESKPEPYYAGLHGPDNKIWQKKLSKHHRGMKMFFIQNDTEGYVHKIGSDITERIFEYSQKTQSSPANFLFYACSLTAAKLNNNTQNMLPLELCNCRGTMAEKKCAGTKVQSIACYTNIDYNKTFNENFSSFCDNQSQVYRHISFLDNDFEMLLHKTYRSSLLETYYYITYSFIPFVMPKGIEFNIYSNGKCALPAYIAQLYDVETKEINMAYDVQTKIISENDVAEFHNKYLSVMKQILENPDVNVLDIKL